MSIGGNAKDQKQFNQELGKTKKIAKEVNDEVSSFPETFKDYRDLVTSINQELGKQVNNVKQASSNYSSLTSIAKQFQGQEEGITRLTDKQLDNNKAKTREALREIKANGEALAQKYKIVATDKFLQEQKIKQLQASGAISDEEAALLRARKEGFSEEEKLVGLIDVEIAKRKESNRLMGVAGGLTQTLNGLLGPLAGKLGLQEAEAEMQKLSDAIANGEVSGGKFKVAMTGVKQIFKGLGEALTDPTVIFGAFLVSFQKYATEAKKVRQETGMTSFHLNQMASEAGTFNTDLVSATDAMETMAALSAETEMNIVAAFGPETIAGATKLNQLAGLGAKETGNMALRAEVLGDNLGDAQGQAIAITKEYANTGKGALKYQGILKDAGNASNTLALSIKGGQKGLIEASAAAAKLGLNLAKVEGIADQLLDFESSINAELEAELLTGKQLNLEKARTAALNNDMKTLAEEIGSNEAILQSFASGNRIQQEAIAKSLGMQKEDVAKMIFFNEKNKHLTMEQRRAAAGISEEEANRLTTQEQFAKAVEKLTAAAAPYLEMLASMLSNTAALATTTGVISVAFAGGALKKAKEYKDNIVEMKDATVSAAKGVKNFVAGFKEGEGGVIKKITGGIGGALGGGAEGAGKAADATKGAAAGGAKQGQGVKGFLKGLGDGLASIGKKFMEVVKGGLALGVVGVILGGSFALAMKMVENVDPVQMITFSGALAIFGATAAIIGKMGSQVMQGAAALLVMGVALIPAAFAFSLLEGLDVKTLTAFSIALPLLSLAAAGLGFIAPFIMAGAAALAVLGLALIPAALGFSMIQGVDMKAVLTFAGGIGILATAAAALGPFTPFILAGSVAIAALGLALIPLSMGFERMAQANTEGLVQNLATFAGLAPAMGLMAASLFGVAGGLGAMAVAGIAALPIVTALAGLGTVATGIAGIFGGGEGETAEAGGTSTAAMEAKLDQLNQNMGTLIATVKEGGVVNIDGNKAGTFFAMGASKMA